MIIFRRHSLLMNCGIGIAIFSGALAAQDLGQSKDIAGGSSLGGAASSLGSLSSITSGTTGNAAGIIEFCIKNNYLKADAVGIKDQLIAKATGSKDQTAQGEADYVNGMNGILKDSDGISLDLSTAGLKSTALKKVCEKIHEQGKSML
ncbi:MAG: DUF2501 domain-containing protein [Nitrosospira sp.]